MTDEQKEAVIEFYDRLIEAAEENGWPGSKALITRVLNEMISDGR